jgi:hypothetical protein
MNRSDTVIIGQYLPRRINDDFQKGVDYYFCRKNLKVYKVVYTKIAIGWYDPPALHCPTN